MGEATLADLMIDLVAERPRTGFELCQALESRHGLALRGREGSVYAALVQLERDGWLVGEFGETPAGVRRIYRLPVLGAVGKTA